MLSGKFRWSRDRLRLAEQDPANEGGPGLAGKARLVRPNPVADRGRLEQVGGHLCGGQLAPRASARPPATRGSGDDGVREAAGVEAQAVRGGPPELRDRVHVLRRPVAHMTLEAIARVALTQTSHEAIAGHLGHDRGGRDGRAGSVSLGDPLVHGRRGAKRTASVPVHKTKLRSLPKGAERPLEAGRVGRIDPDPIDLARRDADERDRLRVEEDGLRETFALATRKALRVVQTLEKVRVRAGGEPLQVEENPRRHDRAGQASTAHLVNTCDQANATSTVVGKEGRVAHELSLFKPTEKRHPQSPQRTGGRGRALGDTAGAGSLAVCASPAGLRFTLTRMAPEKPLGVRRLDFGVLSDDDFELLCYLVVLLEFPDAVRLRRPDLGADSALPCGAERAYTRCWQAKRFTGHVHWGQCVDSLNAAVGHYKMPHYTFCFARDLTGGQETQFKKRMVGLHSLVTVDHWGASRLLGALLGSPQGERIVNHFYPDPARNAHALMQAIRAGGALETGADAAERLTAVAEWLASNDPFFSYPTHTRETGLAGPGLTPGAVIAIEEIGPNVTQRIEAVPRNEAAIDEYGPAGTLLFETSEEGRRALDAFQRAFATRETVTISEGVGLRFDRLPPLMQPHLSEEPMHGLEITIGPGEPGPPSRWPARLITRSDTGKAQIDIDLEPRQAPDGWHGALEGSRGGLTATLLFQRTPTPGVKFNFSFSPDSSQPIADQLAAASTLVALHGKGELEILATDGSRPDPLLLDFDRRELPEFFLVFHRLLTDVHLLAEWGGITITLPHTISRDEMRSIAEAAYIVRERKSGTTFDQVTLELPAEQYKSFERGVPGPLRVEMPLSFALFGTPISLGRLVSELPARDLKIAHAARVPGARPPKWSVRIEPATEGARHRVMRLEPDHPDSP
jgi:hypothetical protein